MQRPARLSSRALTTVSGELDVTLTTTLSDAQLLADLQGQSFDVIESGTLLGIFGNTGDGRVEVTDGSGNDLGSFAVTYNDVGSPSVELSDFSGLNVPEPATSLLLLPAAALVMRRRRRGRA